MPYLQKKFFFRAVSVVYESTELERAEFRIQEKERYENAHKAYVYKLTKENGEVKETIVGPVKVCSPSPI